jgi:hypothetical protein
MDSKGLLVCLLRDLLLGEVGLCYVSDDFYGNIARSH